MNNWQLPTDFRSSIYTGVQCFEYPDAQKVHGFVQTQMGVQEVDKNDTDGTKFEWPHKTEHIMMERYEKLYDPKIRGYRVKHELPEHGYGRVKPSRFLSLAVMVRGTRHGVATDKYIDIDMKCAHPTMLLDKMRSAGMLCAALGEYVSNPSAAISKIMEHHGCGKGEAKTLVLSLMNGGTFKGWLKTRNIQTNADSCLPFVEAVSKELRTAMDKVYADNQQIVADVLALNPKKWRYEIDRKRGCMGLWLQTLERKIQEACIMYLSDKYHIPLQEIVPSQDGFMVLVQHYREGMAEEISEHSKNELNLNMPFLVKPFDEAIEIPRMELEEMTVLYSETFEGMAEEFEKTHCKISNLSLFMKESNDGRFIPMSRANFKCSYEDMTYKVLKDNTITEHNFITRWLTSNPTMRRYEDVGVYPNAALCPKDHLNIWVPFAFHDMGTGVSKPEGVEVILNHIKILCGRDEAVYDYFVKWMAQMVQYPEVKTICPVLISKQGAGKGTLIRLMEQMLGQRKVMSSSNPARDIWGTFNNQMAGSFLVNIDELSKHEVEDGRFKSLVSEPTIDINSKGANMYTIQSYHRFIITTNNEDPIPTSADDRRNFIIRSSDELIGDKTYFTKMYELISDPDVVRSFADYLMAVPDMDRFANLVRPMTSHQSNLAELSRPALESWVIDFVCDPENKSGKHMSTNLYHSFQVYCNNNGLPGGMSAQKFGVSLRNANIDGFAKGARMNTGASWDLDIERIRTHFKIEPDDIADTSDDENEDSD